MTIDDLFIADCRLVGRFCNRAGPQSSQLIVVTACDSLALSLHSLGGMNPKAAALQERTHKFFMRVIRFCENLPDNDATFSIRPQLLDSAGSTDSNYRGACRGRTRDEFIAKVGVAAEEADESKGWLAALSAAGYGDHRETQVLIQEADELTAIFTASQKTARKRKAAAAAAAKRRRRK